jgi:hypothetical protein
MKIDAENITVTLCLAEILEIARVAIESDSEYLHIVTEGRQEIQLRGFSVTGVYFVDEPTKIIVKMGKEK